MKFVVLVVCLFGVAYGAATSDSSSLEVEDFKEIGEFVRDKLNMTIVLDMMKLAEKVQEKCPDLEKKLDVTTDQVAQCIDDIELGSETFCSLIRKNFARCAKPARDLIVSCMPDESKGLPVMGEKILLGVIDQVCNSTVEQLLELFNPCVAEKDFESFPACTDIKSAFDQHKNQLPSQSLICSMLPKLKSCAKAHQEASCTNPVTKSAILNFHEAVEDATKEDCDALNRT